MEKGGLMEIRGNTEVRGIHHPLMLCDWRKGKEKGRWGLTLDPYVDGFNKVLFIYQKKVGTKVNFHTFFPIISLFSPIGPLLEGSLWEGMEKFCLPIPPLLPFLLPIAKQMNSLSLSSLPLPSLLSLSDQNIVFVFSSSTQPTVFQEKIWWIAALKCFIELRWLTMGLWPKVVISNWTNLIINF